MGLQEDYEEALRIAADENAEADALRRALKVLEPIIRRAKERLAKLDPRDA